MLGLNLFISYLISIIIKKFLNGAFGAQDSHQMARLPLGIIIMKNGGEKTGRGSINLFLFRMKSNRIKMSFLRTFKGGDIGRWTNV